MVAEHRDKLSKLLKFEKIMNRFCKDVGIDKKTLLTVLVPESQQPELS